MDVLVALVRWTHLAGALLLLGLFASLLLVVRPASAHVAGDSRPLLDAVERRLLAIAVWVLAALLLSGIADLLRQVRIATDAATLTSLPGSAWVAVLLDTRYGAVWLARHALLLLLGAWLLVRPRLCGPADWWALRLQQLALATASLLLIAGSGHAAAAGEWAGILVDGLHLLAAGVWLGGLLPLALLLRHALTRDDGGMRAAAVGARRFSTLGLVSVPVLVASGAYATQAQVGGAPALIGTPYGGWLLTKVALLLPLLGVALVNRAVLLPRLDPFASRAPGAERDTSPEAALRRMVHLVILELVVGALIVGVAAILGLTTPARHAEVAWPLSFRLSWDMVRSAAGVQTRVAVGSQLAMFGLLAMLLATVLRRQHWQWIAAAGLAAVGLGLAVALPALAVDAYPTTYRRPAVTYTATSVTSGRELYRTHCERCHGVTADGRGPDAAGLRPRPANLTARHTADHTVGDLYGWLTSGVRGSAMPGFADRLTEEERWDVINFVRTLAAAERARTLGPVATPEATLVAPDFAFTRGVGEPQSLRDFREQSVVLLVLFSLPGSLERLLQLAASYRDLRLAGAEVLAVPTTGARDVYRALGPRPIVFPIVVDGAREATVTYGLFARTLEADDGRREPATLAHLELLVDRQGYLRARWAGGTELGWQDPQRLLAEVRRLAEEPARAPAADEHVH